MSFKTTATQQVRLYQIASAMKNADLSDQFIAEAVQLGEYYEGMFDLFVLWEEADEADRAEIVADMQEEIDEAQEQPSKPQRKPMIHFEDLDRIAKDVIGFKRHLRNLVDQWGGISKLAEATGIAQPSLSRFFNSPAMPRRTTLYRIAIAMDLSETEVVGSWAA